MLYNNQGKLYEYEDYILKSKYDPYILLKDFDTIRPHRQDLEKDIYTEIFWIVPTIGIITNHRRCIYDIEPLAVITMYDDMVKIQKFPHDNPELLKYLCLLFKGSKKYNIRSGREEVCLKELFKKYCGNI